MRRSFLKAILTTVSSLGIPQTAIAANSERESFTQKGELITIPLQFTGGSYVLYYRINGDLFRAIVDTGSPFLMVPGSCGQIVKSKWGCYRQEGIPSGLESTYEIFDGNEGEVEWRLTKQFSFVNATGSLMGPSDSSLIFGVASDGLMSGPGGVFFGLVKETDGWIRPSFLSQTSVTSFRIDLASIPRTLSLSTTPLIQGSDYVKLVSDLRRRYGDPTQHYTARAKSIKVNGSFLARGDGKPIYVIFDTGVTGLVVSRELFDERYITARSRRERNLWGDVSVSFKSKMGKTVELSAISPVTTVLPEMPLKNFDGHLVVVGLSFMDDNILTVDIDRGRLWIESGEITYLD